MDYEKKYKELVEAVKMLKETNPSDMGIQNWVKDNVPELGESEDERIRNILYCIIRDNEGVRNTLEANGLTVEKVLGWLEKQGTPARLSEEEQNRFAKGVLTGCAMSFIDYLDAHKYEGKMCVSNGECEDIENAFHNAMWDKLHRYYCKYLEKQGEQKPTDKVEPKFHKDEWIITKANNLYQVTAIIDDKYQLKYGDNYTVQKCAVVDKHAHLWTIQDAKVGDMLFQDLMCGKTFIYNGINPDMAILYSFLISNDGEDVLPYHIGKPNTGIGFIEENKNIIHPATKEQRELLFAKMKEAGYEWDSEKKELKKIEQKPAWSREDEQNLNAALGYIDDEYLRRWMKDAIHAKYDKPDWSEEDEEMFDYIIQQLEPFKNNSVTAMKIDWLKSLKARYTWKPSDAQMKELKEACDEHWEPDGLDPLYTLYQDLKKLKGE